ncbi:MAG: protein kinase [Deltaproteobacteria bacterium]|nr:protein kinase [Deltaproteobacteria bacterium]
MSTPDQVVDERVGKLIAQKYQVRRLLGSGGMGSVYEAENIVIGKPVALKFLHMNAQQDETSLARFQQEARAISAVQSAHIVQVFDWGRDEGGHPFLVMELLAGSDLSERIKQLGRIAVADAVRYAVESLRGLKRVHAAGIVHRDLKPENLYLMPGDDDLAHVKIVDFGLSKLVEQTELDRPGFEQSARITQAGAVVGTPLYMSPEQVEALDEIDHRADLWAMGAILYEMLGGAPPFMERSYARLVMAICQRDAPDLTRINPEVSPPLARAISRAMTRDRTARLQSAEDFIAALAEATPQVNVGATGPMLVNPLAVSKTVPQIDEDDGEVPAAMMAGQPTPTPGSDLSGSAPSSGGPLDATIAAHTRGATTVWLTDAPVFSIWRGDVDSPDRLRVEARDGSVRDLRLQPVGTLTLGRVKQVGGEVNDLVYPDVASRLAARLRHDGIRWWLGRRQECSVPVQVGTRSLARGEEAPLVHGSFVTVGAMRATMVDRRYVSRSVPAGTVDQASGLLARGGLEQEVATALQQAEASGLVLLYLHPAAGPPGAGTPGAAGVATPATVQAAVAIHRAWPSAVVASEGQTVGLIARGEAAELAERAQQAREVAQGSGAQVLASGYWTLEGETANAGSEVELALDAIEASAGPAGHGGKDVSDLRGMRQGLRMSIAADVLERAQHPKHQMLLFGIEEQEALSQVGPKVVAALEHELAAIIATQVGPAAMVTSLAPGVMGACVPRKLNAGKLGVAVQCEWHARPPITDGKVELPRTLSWEEVMGGSAEARAAELSRECCDAHGVLSALSGGLPNPIAGRVHAAIGAASAVERVKMLFDVREGTWRFIAAVLAAAYFAKSTQPGPGESSDVDALHEIRAFHQRVKTRAGLPLGSWRELARLAAKSFQGRSDPIGVLVRELLGVKLSQNQTFDTLSNLLHSERNNFAHGHYNEARAAGDVREFEQMTRTFLRALRPLCAWTLVTVQRTEPDLYGECQTVEFIDHTGPYATGARRRIGFNSPMRLANVVYLARWRDGLVLPLEPFVRRLSNNDRFDLYWMDHLPRAGRCNMSAVVSGDPMQSACDLRRLPPLLRSLLAEG